MLSFQIHGQKLLFVVKMIVLLSMSAKSINMVSHKHRHVVAQDSIAGLRNTPGDLRLIGFLCLQDLAVVLEIVSAIY